MNKSRNFLFIAAVFIVILLLIFIKYLYGDSDNRIDLYLDKQKAKIKVVSSKPIDLRLVTTTIYNTKFVYKTFSDWTFAHELDKDGESMCEWGGGYANTCDLGRYSIYKYIPSDTMTINLDIRNYGINTFVIKNLQIEVKQKYKISDEEQNVSKVPEAFSSVCNKGGYFLSKNIGSLKIKVTNSVIYSYPIKNTPYIVNDTIYTLILFLIADKDKDYRGYIHRFNIKIEGYDANDINKKESVISDKEYFYANY